MKKGHKGITLIALVITIIVMLILVTVTVNVAMNGGLFTQAQKAKTKTDKAAEREKLDSAVVAAYDAVTGEVDRETLVRELGEDWEVSQGNGPWTVENEKTRNQFTVTNKGTITEIMPEEKVGEVTCNAEGPWKVINNGGVYTITGYTGNETSVTIPSVYIDGDGRHTITAIGDFALGGFDYNAYLKR